MVHLSCIIIKFKNKKNIIKKFHIFCVKYKKPHPISITPVIDDKFVYIYEFKKDPSKVVNSDF